MAGDRGLTIVIIGMMGASLFWRYSAHPSTPVQERQTIAAAQQPETVVLPRVRPLRHVRSHRDGLSAENIILLPKEERDGSEFRNADDVFSLDPQSTLIQTAQPEQ